MSLVTTVKKNKMPKATFFLIPVIVVCIIAAVMNMIIANTKEVYVRDEGKVTYAKTLKSSVEQFLEEQNIVLGEYDYIEPPLDTVLNKKQEIIIKRAVPVTILVDGNEITFNTCKDTVEDVLKEADIELNEEDEINYALTDKISAAMKISIIRIAKTFETIEERIPFKVIRRPNEQMLENETKVVQEGAEGVQAKKYAVVLKDGQEVSRELVEDYVVSQPVNKVIEYGTVGTFKTSRGDTLRYKKVLNMRATAYDLSYESCGKRPGDPGYGITATGMRAQHGVVAVDPKVIPLYSRLYIESADGSWAYGHAIAADVGGGVNGNSIDLFYEDSARAKRFGIQRVKVYVLD